MSSPTKLSNELNLRRYWKKLLKFELILRNAIFPLTPMALLYIGTILILCHALGTSPIDSVIEYVHGFTATVFSSFVMARIASILLVAFPLLFLIVVTVRFSFALILYYRGWLFEEIGKEPSWATKIFMGIITLVNKRATFLSYQNIPPWLPIPLLRDTIPKYLETVQPFLSSEEYAEMTKSAEEFESSGVAGQLQKKLCLKWMISPNYVSDWWKEVVYMRYRDSLINTNVGCADIIFKQPTSNQAARAAVVTLLRQQFCHECYTKQTMKPISLGGIPLCPKQYIDYHRTLRVPRPTSDVMVHLDEARHMVVYHKGVWYKLPLFHGRRMLRPAELERAFQHILDNARTHVAAKGEEHLGALTAGPRELWARIREQKFASGLNRESLKMIEDALEIMFLDDEERFWDEKDITKYEREYARALTGDGDKLWCDKPSVYIVSKNGRFTSNAEHSVVDAMIYVHVREYIKYHEEFSGLYQADGHCVGTIEVVPHAERLQWDFDNETLEAIDEAYTVSRSVALDFENAALVFSEYGKDFMKKARVSPDAYIQMALQMTYFKDQNRFDLTYEPAVMRLFRDGRTETVRSCSNQSVAFVKSMLDNETTPKERLASLKVACDRHQDYYRNAMAGRGVDRHLFGLYVISKYYGIKSEFLDNVFSMNYAMSTSQTPQHQMAEYMKVLNKERSLFWPAGGFTCPDGSKYGICYTIAATGDILSFHIVSKKQFKETDCSRFRQHLIDSLREMREMIEAATSNQ